MLGSENGWIYSAIIESLGSTCVRRSHRAHTQAVTCLDTDDQGCVASGSRDGSVAVVHGLFSGDDATFSCSKGSCGGAVVAVKFCRAVSSLLACCSAEASVSVWGLPTPASSGSLQPLKIFTVCVGRVTCLEWVAQSSSALIVGGEQQAVMEVAWRLQPDANSKSTSGVSVAGAGPKAPKAKRQRRDDGVSQDAAGNSLDADNGVEDCRIAAADASSCSAAAAAAASSAAASAGLVANAPAPTLLRTVDDSKGGGGGGPLPAPRRKAAERSVLLRGAATSVVTRTVPEAVESLMHMHSLASGGGAPMVKASLSSHSTLTEILCDTDARAAWVGECALAAAKVPSTADAAVAVSSLAGACARELGKRAISRPKLNVFVCWTLFAFILAPFQACCRHVC